MMWIQSNAASSYKMTYLSVSIWFITYILCLTFCTVKKLCKYGANSSNSSKRSRNGTMTASLCSPQEGSSPFSNLGMFGDMVGSVLSHDCVLLYNLKHNTTVMQMMMSFGSPILHPRLAIYLSQCCVLPSCWIDPRKRWSKAIVDSHTRYIHNCQNSYWLQSER